MKNKYHIEKVTWTKEKGLYYGVIADSQWEEPTNNLFAKSDYWYPMEYGIVYCPIADNGDILIQDSYRWFRSEELRDEEFENIKNNA